jgi:hypothetical protein
MPYDPTRNPLPPLNDGYPDDWHVPPSAQDDSFPDDWHVPPSAQGDSFPDDWYVPPSAQPSGANLGFTASPAPPSSIAAYWSRLAADRQRTAPWAPPMFPDTFGRFPAVSFAPAPRSAPSADALASDAYLQSAPIAPSLAAPQGLFSGLSQPAVGLINEQSNNPEYRLPVAYKKKGSMDPALFDERAFGTAPPYGSGAPRLVPPLGNPGPRDSVATIPIHTSSIRATSLAGSRSGAADPSGHPAGERRSERRTASTGQSWCSRRGRFLSGRWAGNSARRQLATACTKYRTHKRRVGPRRRETSGSHFCGSSKIRWNHIWDTGNQ